MFIIANFLPMYSYWEDYAGYYYYISVFQFLGMSLGFGYLGFLFILISIVVLFRFSVSRVVLYRGLGMSFLGGVSIIGLIAFNTRLSVGGILLLISWIGFLITFIVLASTRQSLIMTTEDLVREYIKRAATVSEGISIQKIARYIKISKRYIPKLREFIQEMIYSKEIFGNLKGNSLQFANQTIDRTSSQIREKPGVIEVDYKKRLFGMIRIRKEIDLEEASQFLNIPPKQIESLLYDLAGDKIIQGTFQGNKFLIESDVDNFLNALDYSFDKWENDKREKV